MQQIKNVWRVFFHYRFLLKNLVSRDIKVKYRRSVLGILWSVLNPLLMMTVMSLMFGILYRDILGSNLPLVAGTGQPPAFSVYVLTGQLVFTFFSESTTMAMDSVLGNAPLIKKVYIPKYIFPLEKVVFGLVNTAFSMIALVLMLLITWSHISPWILLAPLPLLFLFVFNLGVGLLLSCAVVFFRDIKHLYSVFTMALMYMTPLFYPESIFNGNGTMETLVRLNPVYWYVSLFRQLVLYGSAPTLTQWLAPMLCAVVALVLGLVMFRKKQDDFILYI